MTRHHIIITGTGRAGTTFLVQLLTELGLDTGFPGTTELNAVSRAGLEWDILDEHAPYIVKSPHLTRRLDDAIRSGGLVIDHAIVPMRELFEAAESRRFVEAHPQRAELGDVAPGGLWGTPDAEDQEAFLARQTHGLMRSLAVHEIPLTLLDFPRLAQDPAYLHEKLSVVFPDLAAEQFSSAFASVARPELIHQFDPDDDEHHERMRHLSTTREKRAMTRSKAVRDLLAQNVELNRQLARTLRRADKAEARARIAEAALADATRSGRPDTDTTSQTGGSDEESKGRA